MNAAEFRIGRVLRQAVAEWPNFAQWIALTTIIQSPVLFYGLSGLEHHLPSHWALAAVLVAVNSVFSILAQAVVTNAMLMQLGGQRSTLVELLSTAPQK